MDRHASLNRPRRSLSWLWLGLLALGSLLTAYCVGWLLMRAEPKAPNTEPQASPSEAPALNDPQLAPTFAAASPRLSEDLSLGVEVHAHEAAAAMEPAHPITAERALIQHELQLIAVLNDAVDLQNVSRMRQLLEVYRRTHTEDAHDLREGYEVIANCLEFPGEESREHAQRYYDLKRASTLRRYVRRHCLADK